jgi:hypothetical protein
MQKVEDPMVNNLNARTFIWALALLVAVYLPVIASESEDSDTTATQRGELYLPSEDAMADVDQALASAADKGRLALIVLGANWCHDSRALASRLFQDPLKELIDERYELVFVDVGYYESGKQVIRRFGSPIYYATPTVLIVDPDTGQLINAANRHQWGGAHDISMEDSLAYFQEMAAGAVPAPAAGESAELDRLNAEIHALEERLANRVEEAFSVVGPMLRAYKKGKGLDEFQAVWDEVSKFRNAVPRDMQALHVEAERRVAAGETDIQLEHPVYPAFSWQQGKTEGPTN